MKTGMCWKTVSDEGADQRNGRAWRSCLYSGTSTLHRT